MRARSTLAAISLLTTGTGVQLADQHTDPAASAGPIPSEHSVALQRDPDAAWRRAAVTSRRAEQAARDRRARARRLTALAAARAAMAQHKAEQTAATSRNSHVPASTWDAIATCESGGDWHIHSGAFGGGLEMLRVTWATYRDPDWPVEVWDAPRWQQQLAGQRCLDHLIASGMSLTEAWANGWPACSAKLGLR